MFNSFRKNKVIKLIAFAIAVTVITPILLAKLDFYGAIHADPIAAPVSAPKVGTATAISYADSVAQAAPAVVSIKTTKEIPIEENPLMQDPVFRYFFGDPRGDFGHPGQGGNQGQGHGQGGQNELPPDVQQGLGSGVIVSDKGYILTNNHVIKGADTINVSLPDGRTAIAKIIGTDSDTDLAVLKIELEKLPVIPLGSSKELRAGDVVLAIGNPFGLDKTVTLGIISATERTGTEIGIIGNLIQTDAAINPGNSGGALIDAYGRLIGINTAIFSRSGGNQGIGFAIPIDEALNILNQLIKTGHIIRGYMGVMLAPLTQEIKDNIGYKELTGAYVRAVMRDSPAQKAGIHPGDVIVKIDNKVVKDNSSGLQITTELTPGKNYPIEVFRRGDYLTFSVTLGERKQTVQPAPKPKAKEKQTQTPSKTG